MCYYYIKVLLLKFLLRTVQFPDEQARVIRFDLRSTDFVQVSIFGIGQSIKVKFNGAFKY